MSNSKFSDRTRFNWGYHDAASDVEHHRSVAANGKPIAEWLAEHPDTAYHDGYCYGRQDASNGFYENNSEPAWIDYQHSLTHHRDSDGRWQIN